MTEQPKTVVCASCDAKFHVPDELIRGKLVKFRCRKCGSAIDVDGRKSARPPADPASSAADVAGVDTPATFSQRTLPPPRPPVALSASSPGLHPWPEPPRTRSTTAPTAMENITAEPSASHSVPVHGASNRGPKIAAVVALIMAAGLSGIGLAMRTAPGPSAGVLVHGTPEPPSPDPGAGLPNGDQANASTENKAGAPARPGRAATRVSDLPPAVDEVEARPAPTGASAGKPTEAVPEKREPPASHDSIPASPDTVVQAESAAANAPVNGPSSAPISPPVANQAPAGAPPAARAAKGDFNTQAAREALEDAAARAAKCKTIDTPSGTARVAVTFAPTGHATNAVIESGPFVGTSAGSCVAAKFRNVRVPPFSGESVQVRKSVPF
jgi:hypothetical protein